MQRANFSRNADMVSERGTRRWRVVAPAELHSLIRTVAGWHVPSYYHCTTVPPLPPFPLRRLRPQRENAEKTPHVELGKDLTSHFVQSLITTASQKYGWHLRR